MKKEIKNSKTESYFVFNRDNSLEKNHWYFVGEFNTKEDAENEMEEIELDTDLEHKVIKGIEFPVNEGCSITRFHIKE